MVDPSYTSTRNGNSVGHNPPSSLAPPLPPFPSPGPGQQRYLPPGASYAYPSPSSSPAPTRLHRLDTSNQPPTLSLSIGSRSPLVGSADWPPSADPSFTGIPSGRLQSSNQQPSPRQTQSAHFPSFALPPNLSPNDALRSSGGGGGNRDRGPYPPHVRSQSTGMLLTTTTSLPPSQVDQAEDSELLVDRTDRQEPQQSQSQQRKPSLQIPLSSSPASPLVTGTSSNQATSERPLSIADQVVGTPPPQSSIMLLNSPFTGGGGDSNDQQQGQNATTSDMAGIGRNSIIRSATGGGGGGGGASSPGIGFRSSVGPSGGGGGGGISPNLDSSNPRNSFLPLVQTQQSPGQQRSSTVLLAGGTTTNPPNSLLPHLVPQPEICVECMMRDRDMADVDVTTYGIWDRESDRDWNEQLKWEREQDDRDSNQVGTLRDPEQEEAEQVRSDGTGARGQGVTETGNGNGSAASQESGSGVAGERRRGSTTNASHHSRDSYGTRPFEKRRRLGMGQALTSGNLKVWTTMNPPAAAHRWRTLQTFLATQIHLLELDRQARARESALLSSQHSHAPSQTNRNSRSSTFQVPISTTPEPYEGGRARAKSGGSRGYLVDETNRKSNASSLFPPPTPHQPQLQSQPQSQAYPQPPPSAPAQGPPYPTHPQYNHPSLASSGVSIQTYSYGDQPWLSSQSSRRYSYSKDANSTPSPPTSTKSPAPSIMKFNLPKFARSTTDLRSISSPRSLSPARNSLFVDDREGGGGGGGGRRSSTSLWSKFRQSTSNQSVLSFNPSASMMDMHLGLSQDKHHGAFSGAVGGGGGGGSYRTSGYASSTIGIGQRGYSYHQPQGPALYDTYPGGEGMRGLNMSDPAVARHAELRERDRALAAGKARGASETASTKDKKKKKGIKGFFSKLVGGGGSGDKEPRMVSRDGPLHHSAPLTPAGEAPYTRPGGGGGGPNFDDDELAPPPPLSALANEPRYHQRSSSTSSVDSFTGPYTPPLHPSNFRNSYAMPLPSSSNPAADRQSILTTGSYSSAPSKPNQPPNPPSNARLNPSRDSVNRPSFDSLTDSPAHPRMTNSPEVHQYRAGGGSAEVLAAADDGTPYPTYPVATQPRYQKSLPSLPNELSHSQSRSYPNQDQHPPQLPASTGQFYPNYQTGASRSAYSLVQFPSRPLSPPESPPDERDRYSSVGSRNGNNARKTRSTVFSFFGRKKSGEDTTEQIEYEPRDPHRARSFDLVSRY